METLYITDTYNHRLVVSEELSSVETLSEEFVRGKMKILVSEELSSVETKVAAHWARQPHRFQKNLVVWKPNHQAAHHPPYDCFRRT